MNEEEMPKKDDTEQEDNLYRIFLAPYIEPSNIQLVMETESEEEAMEKSVNTRDNRWNEGLVIVRKPDGELFHEKIKFVVDGEELPLIESNERIQLLHYPDKVLKSVSKPVKKKEAETEDVKTFVARMLLTMYTSPGIGLAAPQVGVFSRIIVLDTDWAQKEKISPSVIYNPMINEHDKELQNEVEGCLSVVGGFHTNVKRYIDVVVTGRDTKWEKRTFAAYGLEAAAFQHEVDHLDGLVFLDRIGKLRKDMYNRKLRKVKRIAKKQAKHLIRLAKENEKREKLILPWVELLASWETASHDTSGHGASSDASGQVASEST